MSGVDQSTPPDSQADEGSQATQTVDDPEDYRQQTRLKGILETRERVLERRRDASELYHFGEIDQSTRNTIIRNAVEEYILEVEHLLRDLGSPQTPTGRVDEDSLDVSKDYWTSVHLGTMEFPGDKNLVFNGLKSILDATEILEVQWYEQTEDEVEGQGKTLERWRGQIRQDILVNAYRQTNGFLYELGMDLQTNPDDGDAAFEYTDILEEGPPSGEAPSPTRGEAD